MDDLKPPPTSAATNHPSSSKSIHLTEASACQIKPSLSNLSVGFPHSMASQSLIRHPSRIKSSRTWTPSSGGLGLLSDADEVQDRAIFVQEYNRLAKKHGVRLLIVEYFDTKKQRDEIRSATKKNWFLRLFRASPSLSEPSKPQPLLRPRHKRSVSDLGYLIHPRREPPKMLDIQTMVRLSGKSILYLPQEYSPCSLILPTCIRATAQYVAQNATTRGIFRIPGSVKIVNSIFDYYCYLDNDSLDVAGTVCCATLPSHIEYSIHDVSSAFKRFLSMLPGGILGSLSLFDAFIAIHSQLNGEPEYPRTKQTKVRARLIALAIGTIESQFRRELICAVFGLLSLIGRVAEVTPREDEDGRPLPTGDLMGYGALGIVFGPLLVGNLLDQYTMKLASPSSGLLLLPLSPKKHRRDRVKVKLEGAESEPPHVDKVIIANDIAEMLITNWRDMVRQMRSLGIHCHHETVSIHQKRNHAKSPSTDSFIIRFPQDLNETSRGITKDMQRHDTSPEPPTPTLAVRRHRSRPLTASNNPPSVQPNRCPSYPTLQSKHLEAEMEKEKVYLTQRRLSVGVKHVRDASAERKGGEANVLTIPSDQTLEAEAKRDQNDTRLSLIDQVQRSSTPRNVEDKRVPRTPCIHIGSVPPRLSSKWANGERDTATVPAAHETSKYFRNFMDEGGNGLSGPYDRRGIRAAVSDPNLAGSRIFVRSPLSDKYPYDRREAPTSALRGVQETPIRESNTISQLQADSAACFGHNCCDRDHAARNDELKEDVIKGSLSYHLGTCGVADGCSDLKEGLGMLPGSNAVCPSLHSSLRELDHQNSMPIQNIEDHQTEYGGNRNNFYDFKRGAPDAASQNIEQSIFGTHNGLRSIDSRLPARQRSVRAIAAMFENQKDVHDVTPDRHIGSGQSNQSHQIRNVSEGADILPTVAHRVSATPQKVHLATSADYSRPSHSTTFLSKMSLRGYGGSTLDICEGETNELQTRIRQLEKLLDNKTTEIEVLRTQLQNQESPDVLLFSKKLMVANQSLKMWKERAEAAESRMRTFEKFTMKLRSIRASVGRESSRGCGNINCDPQSDSEMRTNDKISSTYEAHGVRFTRSKSDLKMEQGITSNGSGLLDEGSIVPARIRNCVHRDSSKHASSIDSSRHAAGNVPSMDGVASPRGNGMPTVELAAIDVWVAAQELLRMEDEGMVDERSLEEMETSTCMEFMVGGEAY